MAGMPQVRNGLMDWPCYPYASRCQISSKCETRVDFEDLSTNGYGYPEVILLLLEDLLLFTHWVHPLRCRGIIRLAQFHHKATLQYRVTHQQPLHQERGQQPLRVMHLILRHTGLACLSILDWTPGLEAILLLLEFRAMMMIMIIVRVN
ncbi:uncharacterized protein LOC136042419 isoform X2 [Artemia franciscana]|uniref:uncharacterized protein LOC136042419 isoform X2 n=1 Tax=Artemia franciscana TaxID=6661 RepID=UPI0032DBA6F7